MSKIRFNEIAAPSTPPSGKSYIYVDSSNGHLYQKDDTGATYDLTAKGLIYKGAWNASTNTPTLADGTGTAGDYYIVSVSGSQDLGSGSITFTGSDWIIYSDTGVWQKIDASDAVTSVNTQTGAVVLDADDIDDTSTTNKFVTATDITNLGNLSGTNTGDVTVSDTAEIDLTLTGQALSASIVSASIDETKLDVSVNASLDLADSALQSSDIGTSVQAHSSVLDATTASYTTADETKVDFISVTQAVNLDTIEARVNDLDASVVLRGAWDASAGTFPGGGTAQAGDSYIVSVGGTVDSVEFVANDRIVAILDNASTTTYASNWLKLDYTDAVLSVNTQTGAVVLDADDIDDTSTTNKFVTATDITNLANLSGTNTGDVTVTDSSEIDFTLTGQDLTASIISGSIDETKLDTSVNASLDLADSSVQPNDTVTFTEVNTTGQMYSAQATTLTPTGTTQTVDFDNGNAQVIDLGSATGNVTLTLSNPNDGAAYLIKFIQGATARNVVLPSTVLVPGGTAPNTLVLTSTNDAVDTLTLYYDGTNYIAQLGLNYA